MTETKTDNELIAEFMGREISGVVANFGEPVIVYLSLEKKGRSIAASTGYEIARYDTSYDWLMPVVQKIRPLMYEVDIDSVQWRRVSGHSIFASIDDVYKSVVEFIKWYNQSKAQQS